MYKTFGYYRQTPTPPNVSCDVWNYWALEFFPTCYIFPDSHEISTMANWTLIVKNTNLAMV